VLGKSETVTPLTKYFQNVQPALKLYRRCGDRVNLPMGDGSPLYAAAPRQQPIVGLQHAPVERPHRVTLSEQIGNILMQAPIGIVVVDRHYDIASINAAARDMLNIRSVALGEDLVHLATAVPSADLRAAIDAAFRMETQDPVGHELRVIEPVEGGNGPEATPRFLQIYCYADKTADGGHALVLITDDSAAVRNRMRLEQDLRQMETSLQQANVQRQELATERQRLMQANKDLMESNLSLRESNERLLVSVEESESSTEEIETLNEEMQATNEELETLNEELQATVEELNTTNDELEARTRELQMTVTSQEERRMMVEQRQRDLAAILDNLKEPIVAIDGDGKVLFANQAYERLKLPEPNKLRFSNGKEHGLDQFLKSYGKGGTWMLVGEKRQFKISARALESSDGSLGTLLTVSGP
jgi:two-component system CheB/CheR fusion protein